MFGRWDVSFMNYFAERSRLQDKQKKCVVAFRIFLECMINSHLNPRNY
jgi:hypothetical protein